MIKNNQLKVIDDFKKTMAKHRDSFKWFFDLYIADMENTFTMYRYTYRDFLDCLNYYEHLPPSIEDKVRTYLALRTA